MKKKYGAIYRGGLYLGLASSAMLSGCQTYYVETSKFNGYAGRTNQEMVEAGELEKKTRLDPEIIDFDKSDFGEIAAFIGSISSFFLL